MKENIIDAAKFIRKKTSSNPKIGIILGTGLGTLAKEIKTEIEIPYQTIPHFPKVTLKSHAGNLIFGELSRKKIVAMQGRFHCYEGYSATEITFPVRVMKELGISTLLVSNAAGGLNRTYKLGDIMIIEDHINFMGVNPLIGPNDDSLGPRYPDMCEPYDKELINLAEKIALKNGIRCRRGVYIAVLGPNLETAAEYRFFSTIGADAVGMSTVPEVIVARHANLKVFGFSCITDMCIADRLEPVDIQKIIKTAENAKPKITKIILELVASI